MNTSFLGPAVATVLTACGIETGESPNSTSQFLLELQQYLPLAVLKLQKLNLSSIFSIKWLQQYLPLAVLKRRMPIA